MPPYRAANTRRNLQTARASWPAPKPCEPDRHWILQALWQLRHNTGNLLRLAGFLDWVRSGLRPHRLERGLIDLVFEPPLSGVLSALSYCLEPRSKEASKIRRTAVGP